MLNRLQKSRKVNRSEEIEQARFVRWTHRAEVRHLMPGLAYLHHSPNGGVRDSFAGAQMKALGTKPGFPDLIVPVATRTHPGLIIEMKSATGSATTAQKAWLDHFIQQQWSVWLARSASDARDITCGYFGIDPGAAPAMDG